MHKNKLHLYYIYILLVFCLFPKLSHSQALAYDLQDYKQTKNIFPDVNSYWEIPNVPMGTISINLNPSINIPETFTNQEIQLALYCPDYDPNNNTGSFDPEIPLAGGLFPITLFSESLYSFETQLPIGEYILLYGCMYDEDPNIGGIHLPAKPFLIQENETFALTVYFSDKNLDSSDEPKGIISFSHTPSSSTEIVSIEISNDAEEKFSLQLTSDNFWSDEILLPLNDYFISSITSSQVDTISLEKTDFSVYLGSYELVSSISEPFIPPLEPPNEEQETFTPSLYLIISLIGAFALFGWSTSYALHLRRNYQETQIKERRY